MDRILHNVDNAHKILQLTSDTLILVTKTARVWTSTHTAICGFCKKTDSWGKICSTCFPTIPSRNCYRTSGG